MRNPCIATALVAALCSAALAADRRVGPGQTYAKIQDAVNAAQPNDRIVVPAGVYAENVVVGVDGLKFIGSKGAVWDGTVGGVAGICLSGSAKNVLVQGFSFRAGSMHVGLVGAGETVLKCASSGAQQRAVSLVGDGARVESCTIVGAGGVAVTVMGANAVVRRNRIEGAGEDGVVVDGDAAVIDGNTIRNTGGSAIYVIGAGAKATKNVGSIVGEFGVFVVGDTALVQANSLSSVSASGVQVQGADAKILVNRVVGTVGTGIYVIGDRLTVSGNRVDVTVNDTDEIDVYSDVQGGGLVEKNVVNDSVQRGFYLATNHAVIRSNKAVRCGSENDGGFYVSGDDNTLSSNFSQDGDGQGFLVYGSRNAFAACVANSNTMHGIYVAGGADNSFTGCSASGNDGDGFQNRAQTTDLVGGTFSGNRVDVTNAGTFDRYEGVKAGTGGKNTTPDF